MKVWRILLGLFIVQGVLSAVIYPCYSTCGYTTNTCTYTQPTTCTYTQPTCTSTSTCSTSTSTSGSTCSSGVTACDCGCLTGEVCGCEIKIDQNNLPTCN